MKLSILRILLVSANIVLALLIFQNGFLLKRLEISTKSKCSDAHGQPGGACWMRQQYRRVILILVDALRYDFLIPPPKDFQRNSENWHFRGQMKNVEDLLNSGKASIGTLLADPPTTTLQRLKALTTGTLPTFIDAGDNFSPDATVNEDNFVYQAKYLGKNVTLLGDDTWLSLFPNHFSKSAAYDSFDINDLNSVDDKIAPKLQEEIVSNQSSSIIIAHFLGVDHCGHKFGPAHPVMADTLRKMDRIIGETVENMNSDDLLIVLGDHGMTSTGDHGGESDNEIRAGILIHSKNQELRLPDRPIHQIDIVPTVSLLMGLPIPFSNLGTVIREMIPRDLWEIAVAMNYEQVKLFAETYATQNSFGELHKFTTRDSNTMEEQMATLSQIQTVLRAAWTQFDDTFINVGILSMVEAILFAVTNEQMSMEWIVVRTGCGLLQMAILMAKTNSEGVAETLLLMALFASSLCSLISLALRALQFHFSLKSIMSSSFLGPIFVLIHSLCLFSNSFVVFESKMVAFLLQTLVFLSFLEKIRTSQKPRKPYKLNSIWKFLNQDWNLSIFLVISLFLRLEPIFHRCREEEIGCEMYWAPRQAASLTKDAQVFRILIAIAAMVLTNLSVFRFYGNSKNSGLKSETIRILSATSWVLIALVTFQLIFSSMLNDVANANFTARMLFFTAICCGLIAAKEKNFEICGHFLLMPVYLLLGDGLIPALLIFMFLSVFLRKFVGNDSIGAVVALLIPYGFYFLGHSPVISSIPWNAAFVGIPGGTTLRLLPALLVLVHLNFSAISSVFVVGDGEMKSTLILMTIRALLSCIVASVHRRHLMVWKIFAPKFIFEAILCISFLISANLFLIFRVLTRNRESTNRLKIQ